MRLLTLGKITVLMVQSTAVCHRSGRPQEGSGLQIWVQSSIALR